MDKNIVELDDFNVKVDLKEIEKMSKEEVLECKKIIDEIRNKIEE